MTELLYMLAGALFGLFIFRKKIRELARAHKENKKRISEQLKNKNKKNRL